MKDIKYPDNYENWPTTWKSCFVDGFNAGRASAHNSDYAKSKTCANCGKLYQCNDVRRHPEWACEKHDFA